MRHFSISLRQAAVIVVMAAAGFLLACGIGGPEIKRPDKNPSPSPTPTEREVSGVFNVTGAADNGNDAYSGILNITNQGDVYGFRWSLTKGTQVGAGVQIGDGVAATYSSPSGGKGCGVVLYKIASDGSMDGRIVQWGEEKFGTEKAVRTEGRTFTGKYDVTGTTADGQQYKGSLNITKDGAGFDLEWSGDRRLVAFGTWKGSYAAASFGGRQCSFALYSITGGNGLEGNWGGQRAVTFGTESAKRK